MSFVVTLPYDPVWTPLDWAKKHCKSYITNSINRSESYPAKLYKIDYHFYDERDAVWFALKWT